MIKEDKQNHNYTESSLEKYFPELDHLNAIALRINIKYYDSFKWYLIRHKHYRFLSYLLMYFKFEYLFAYIA